MRFSRFFLLRTKLFYPPFFFKESYKADRYLINFVIVLFNKAIACWNVRCSIRSGWLCPYTTEWFSNLISAGFTVIFVILRPFVILRRTNGNKAIQFIHPPTRPRVCSNFVQFKNNIYIHTILTWKLAEDLSILTSRSTATRFGFKSNSHLFSPSFQWQFWIVYFCSCSFLGSLPLSLLWLSLCDPAARSNL